MVQLRMKLQKPRLRSNVIDRPRLVNKLKRAETSARLFVISGLAGYGKTTIASQWLAGRQGVVWINLDEGDNDPVRFWGYLITGLHAVDPQIGKGALNELQSVVFGDRQSSKDDMPGFLCTLLNDLAELGETVFIVLDGYHTIGNEALKRGMGVFINYLPEKVKLVLITRQEPDLPIGRLRVLGELLELTQQELKFQLDETIASLQNVTGQDISKEAIQRLHERTDGWIACLQLAASSMKGREVQGQSTDLLHEGWRQVQEYFFEEILSQKNEEMQQFLLFTSVANFFDASFCQHLTGLNSCNKILEDLLQEGLVQQVGASHSWFRYQGLFHDLLRDYLKTHYDEILPSLHNKACEYWAKNNYVDEALNHAISAGDIPAVARVLADSAEEMFNRGEIATLSSWIVKLPIDEVRKHHKLAFFLALHLLFNGQMQEMDVFLDNLDQTLLGDHKGRVYAIRAFASHFRGDVQGLIKWTKMAQHLIEPKDISWYLGISMMAADCLVIKGDVKRAKQEYLRALAISKQEQQNFVALVLGVKLAKLYANGGQLTKASLLCDEMLLLGEESGFANSERVMVFWIIKGDISCERNKLEEAKKYYEQTASLSAKMPNHFVSKWCQIGRLRIMFALDNLDEVERTLDEVESSLTIRDTFLPSMIVDYRVKLAIRRGSRHRTNKLGEAKRLLDQRDTGNLRTFTYYREVEFVTHARLLVAEEKFEEALEYLNQLENMATNMGLTGRLVEILLLCSIAQYALGYKEKAVHTMRQLMPIAIDGGYIRVFLDEGPSAAKVLRLAKELGFFEDHIEEILKQFPYEIPVATSLTEQLGERELEVLNLMDKGLTNQEIAEALFISLSTVKWHASNIYGKLMVSNRVQAIDKARKIGLLC